MHPDMDASPVDTNHVRNMVVFDSIYNPAKTRLLQDAENNNCLIISGMEMFINQASEQFRLWTGIQPDINMIMDIMKWN